MSALNHRMGLFEQCPEDSCQMYRNVFKAETEMMLVARNLCIELWSIYEPYADEHFKREIQKDFSARFWEMDLTCFLLKQDRQVACLKPGPDIKTDDQVWIEAISPTKGAEDSPDRVADIEFGVAQQVDGKRIALRYTSAIAEKYGKYLSYLDKNVIQDHEPYVIALNSSQIPHAGLDECIPRIAKSLFAIGSEYVTFDRDTLKQINSGHDYQGSIKKQGGSDVPTDIFLDPNYAGISAVLYSNSDAVNRAENEGQGFLLIHNPLAKNPIEEGYLQVGTEIIPERKNDSEYSLRFESHEST